jgi:RNA polymerase sigma factor (sigma-70 family)
MLSIARSHRNNEADTKEDIQHAFGEHVYRHVENVVTSLCLPWVPQLEEDIEDIRQACMLKIFQSIKAYDGSIKFTSWAWCVCRNLMIQAWRKKQRRNNTFGQLNDFSDIHSVPAAPDQSSLRHDIATATRSLAALYPKKKDLVFSILGNPDDPRYRIPCKIVISDVAKTAGVGEKTAKDFYEQKVVPFLQRQFA